MTALPIIETLAGDVSAYIPTNVISITDGQIYLESELFSRRRIRPAVNAGLSVSRVGGAAQIPAMKKIAAPTSGRAGAVPGAGSFFSISGQSLTKTQDKSSDRGECIREILKQPQYDPMRSNIR